MEIDDAPEEPAPPLGPGPKLGTVVAMVDFRPPAETGQQPYYQDHNARLEAQRRKAEATERRILETFYGVPASTWAEAAALPLVSGSPEQRMGHSQVIEWKKTLRVGDTIDVLHQGFWHEAVIRSVPVQTSNPYAYSYASWSVGLTAFDGRLVSGGRTYGSSTMAPRGMFVGNWRASLAVGDRVEARLDDNTWAMARVTAAADADDEEAKPKPAPARGGGVDICLVVIAGERFESSLEAGGVVNKGAEYRTLVRDTETFGSLRRTWAQQHGLQESELTLWSRPDPAPAPAPASSSPLGKLGSWVGGKLNAMTAPAPAPAAATQVPGPRGPDVRIDLESCARDLNLAGTATIVVTKNLDVVTTEATGLLELTVVVGGDETKLELPRSSPRLTRAGTHCKKAGLTKLKALELMGPPKDVLRRILYEYLSKKDPRRCHSGEIGTLVRECATQEDTHRVLAKLAEEFGDGNFPLPPLPDVEQAPLEIADGALKHESGLSTKKDSSHHYGYGSRYRDANTSDAVSALLARRGASAAMDIRASLGHVGLNWTPKRHGTVSPALAERIKVALLCAVRDRKRPHKERSLALLPNRILIHNIFSYLADVNSVRINGSLLLDETPPNGVYRAGHLREVSRGYRRGTEKKFVAEPLSKLGDSPIGFLAKSIVVKVPVSLEIDLKPDWIKLVTPQLVEQANPYGGYRRPRYSYTHTSNDASREQLSTLIATLAHASADAGASVQEVAQSSILAGTPWASPEAPPAKLTKAAPHLAILEAARPSSTAPMVPSPPAMSSTTLRPYQRRALAWMIARTVRKSTSASGRPGGIIYYSGRLDAARECLASSHEAS